LTVRPEGGTRALFTVHRALASRKSGPGSRQRSGAAQRPTASAPTDSTGIGGLDRPVRALVIDDSPVARMLLRTVLDSFDVEVDEAANGTDAVEAWAHKQPDIVFLDWTLRFESGSDVLALLRQAAGDQLPPVVAVSAGETIPAAAGLQSFIRKPFTPREIYTTIQKALGLDDISGQVVGG